MSALCWHSILQQFKKQYLSLASNKRNIHYFILEYTNPPKILSSLYVKEPCYDSEGDEKTSVIFDVKINGMRPLCGSKIWVGITTDNAYGESVVHSYTKSEIIQSLVNLFLSDYRNFIKFPRAEIII